MVSPIYPLKQVLEVKERRVSEAEKVVQEKLKLLEKEETTLKEKEASRDKVKQHYEDKLKQIREQGETTSPKILQMNAYSKVVKEKLVGENKQVDKQKEIVKVAQTALDAAKLDLKQKRIQVDKVNAHKTEWNKEVKEELRKAEEKEHDELGNVIHTTKTRNSVK